MNITEISKNFKDIRKYENTEDFRSLYSFQNFRKMLLQLHICPPVHETRALPFLQSARCLSISEDMSRKRFYFTAFLFHLKVYCGV
jgi:hypothetical protein